MYYKAICLTLLTATFGAFAQVIDVDVNLNVRHEVDGISTFDRSRFITLHSDPTENEWNHGSGSQTNFTDNLLADFIDGYDVYFGRQTGGITWQLTNRIEQDPSRPGFTKLSSVQHWGNYTKNNYEGKPHLHPYEAKWERSVIAAQLFPFYPGGSAFPGDPTSSRRCGPSGAKWDLSTADTLAEPWGTATGEYMGRFLQYFHGGPGETGQPRPGYFTIVNEPLYWLSDVHDEPPTNVFRFFNTCADEVRDHVPDMKIAGYTTAHPNFEVDDFQRWEERWETFIDRCGTNMDLWCIHLYDNAGHGGKEYYRRGGNVEATFDMIEQYSQLALGDQKSFIISEYGATAHDYDQLDWSPWKDWLGLKSISALMMTFMDRPHLIEASIPFIMLKAEWAGLSPPHGRRLMRHAYEADGETGDHWVYTEFVKFYQLWSDVNGTRVDVVASDADLQTDAYVDGDKLYLILNNLEFSNRMVDLNVRDFHGNPVQQVRIKHLYLNDAGTQPVLEETVTASVSTVELRSEATMILEYTFLDPVEVDESSLETKYYATDYLRAILMDTPEEFTVNGVSNGTFGEAVLRIGVGRDHGQSLQPIVLFNGTPLDVPADWMGDDQAQKDRFFGLREIPVPNDLLQADNTVSIQFPDSGGHISSVTLRVFEFSRDIRGQEPPQGSIFTSTDVVGADIVLSVSNGVPFGSFDLMTATDLMLPASNWIPTQVGLVFNGTGKALVTNPVSGSRAFYRILEPGTIPVTGVSVSPSAPQLLVGQSVQLTADVTPADAADLSVTWSSDMPAVASVDLNGLVTCHQAGTAVITATTTDGGFTDSSTVDGVSGLQVTFDWAEAPSSDWWVNYNYTETESGVTMVSSGRAATRNTGASGTAFKATYYQDESPGVFRMQMGGTDKDFRVHSIDIRSSIGSVPSGEPLVIGLLDGVEKWSIDPVDDAGLQTYTTATTGDLSLMIDEMVWEGPYDPANPSTELNWNNEIDNLTVEIAAP